jgi:hypothetical protein
VEALRDGVQNGQTMLPEFGRHAKAICSSAHFPKFVLHRCTHFHELRKVMGTRKLVDSSAAFLFEVPGSHSPLVVQELQIGGTDRNGLWASCLP